MWHCLIEMPTPRPAPRLSPALGAVQGSDEGETALRPLALGKEGRHGEQQEGLRAESHLAVSFIAELPGSHGQTCASSRHSPASLTDLCQLPAFVPCTFVAEERERLIVW